MKKVVTAFGRMNPPTSGHQKLVDKIDSLAKGADARVYLSHSQNNKKDPLDYDTKIKLAQKAFGSSVIKSDAKTIIQVMQELERLKYTDVVLVAGSDRVASFTKLLNQYNGKDYTFDSIKVVSAGQRDPDADDVSGMSASKLRGLAKEGNFAEFKKGLPRALQTNAKMIYDKLRSIMEQPEELDEFVLNLQQRRARARLMKRISKKTARMRKIRAKRMADTNRLHKRAMKKAKNILRKKLAGSRGAQYKELSAGQKITIDKMVEKKSAIIGKLAKRLMPKVRKAELERVAAARGHKQQNESVELTETAMKKTFNSLFKEAANANPNEKQVRQAIKREKEQDKVRHDRMRDQARLADVRLQNRQTESLERKAEESGWDLEIIKEVYSQGVLDYDKTKETTVEQQAFQAVNSFIANNKDLSEMLLKKGSKWVLFSKDGSKKLGEFDSKEDALKRERQIQFFKHQGESVEIDELSKNTLASYKKKAGADASAADKAGDFKRGNKRFSGIMRATKKEFEKEEVDLEENTAVRNKAEKSGVSYDTLMKVYRRGVAAWNSGHRPGTTPEQWGLARVNSYITKGKGTYHGADKDLREASVPKDKESGEPKKYVSGLSKSTAKARAAHWDKMDKLSDRDPRAYEPAPGDATAETKPSKHTLKFKKMYGEAVSPEKSKKRLKDMMSKSGAGEWGTDELTKNYVNDTPGMSIQKWAPGYVHFQEVYCPETNELIETLIIEEAEYEGRKVKLNDPFRLPAGSKKKFGVYVKNDKGNVVKVTFGDPNMEIKRDDPERRKAFRSRHSCDDDIGPKWKARYWSCYQWRAGKKVEN